MAADPETAPPKGDNHSDDAQYHGRTNAVVDADLARDAQFAADAEKSMSLWQGMRAYPKAVGWSVVISMATVMDGYDTGFLAALLGLVSRMVFCLIVLLTIFSRGSWADPRPILAFHFSRPSISNLATFTKEST